MVTRGVFFVISTIGEIPSPRLVISTIGEIPYPRQDRIVFELTTVKGFLANARNDKKGISPPPFANSGSRNDKMTKFYLASPVPK